MIPLSTSLKYYKRKDVQEAIVAAAEHKEVAVVFGEKGYGKRPDVLVYPRDVLAFAQQGATSFHCSEELWSNPLQIRTGMSKSELSKLRTGWDMIIDIDCPVLDYSKVAGHVLVQALQHHGIQSFGVKFSGNHGFHIGIPAKAFPDVVQNTPTAALFPDGPRFIAAYLQDFTREMLAKELLCRYSINAMCTSTKKTFAEVVVNNVFDPYKLLAIDTILISSRHLYRMPYSFNEKSGLVSIPIRPEEVLTFDKTRAIPERVVIERNFMNESQLRSGEARQLILQSFDHCMRSKVEETDRAKQVREFSDTNAEIMEAVPELFFPPCMLNILKGVDDGRKRCLFVLVNFLSSIGWGIEKTDAFLLTWNTRNKEPLPESHIHNHIRYHYSQHSQGKQKPVLPPNCFNQQYYMELGFCKPDGFCPKIKNPANYAILKQKITAAQTLPKKRGKAKTDNKTETEMSAEHRSNSTIKMERIDNKK